MSKYLLIPHDEKLLDDVAVILDHIKDMEGVRENAGRGTALEHATLQWERKIRRDEKPSQDELTDAIFRWRDLAYPVGRQVKRNHMHASDDTLNAQDQIGEWLESLDTDKVPDDKRFPVPTLKSKAGYNRVLISIVAIVMYANEIRREQS